MTEYASDLNDREWEMIKHYFDVGKYRNRKTLEIFVSDVLGRSDEISSRIRSAWLSCPNVGLLNVLLLGKILSAASQRIMKYAPLPLKTSS